MALPASDALSPSLPVQLTTVQFQDLAEIPPGLEWFANLTNPHTRRAYQQNITDFQSFAGLRQPEQFRDVTRAHVIAWRQQLTRQSLAHDTIRHKLAALSSLYAYFCDRHAACAMRSTLWAAVPAGGQLHLSSKVLRGTSVCNAQRGSR